MTKQTGAALAVLLGIVTSVVAQGTVTFANLGMFPTAADRYVYCFDGTGFRPLVGTNYVAQLYYGTDASSLQEHTAAPSRFRPITTGAPGTWIPGTRTLTGFTEGSVVTMQIRVWDPVVGPELAGGQSQIFTYTVPQSGSPASQYLMDNYRGGIVVPCIIPEPQRFMLVSIPFLGALLWVHWRPKRKV